MIATKVVLSESTNGQPFFVASTSQVAADLVHTAVSGSNDIDEVWLYVCNIDSVDRTINIQLGDDTDATRVRCVVEANKGAWLVLAGQPLNGATEVKAWADATNKFTIFGWVNRLTA